AWACTGSAQTWPSTTNTATPMSSQDDKRRTFTRSSLVSARHHVKHSDCQLSDCSCLDRSEARKLARLDQIDQRVPSLLLEHGQIPDLTDPYLAGLSDDLDFGHAVHPGHSDIFTSCIRYPSFSASGPQGRPVPRPAPSPLAFAGL